MHSATGNIVNVQEGVIAHVVNSWGLFGAGVAGAIRAKWPEAERRYQNWFSGRNRGISFKLGDVLFVELDQNTGPTHIAHMLAMNGVRTKTNKTPLDYRSLGICLDKVYEFCGKMNSTLHIPKIGSGLAGGDWHRISTILEIVQERHPEVLTTVWELDRRIEDEIVQL